MRLNRGAARHLPPFTASETLQSILVWRWGRGRCDGDYVLMEAVALVSDDHVLVAVAPDDFTSDFEDHLLLSTRSLRWQGNVDYGHDMIQNAIAATDGHGRWITRGPDTTVRLWQLPTPITDEIPGQLQLW